MTIRTEIADPHLGAVVLAARAMIEAGGPLPVEELARGASVSSRTLRRVFVKLLGVGPRAFGQAVRTGNVRELLRSGGPVTRALVDAGFGSTRGFYETTAVTLGMPAGRYAVGAPGETLTWTSVRTEVGMVLAVASARGLCAVRIGPQVEPLLDDVRREFFAAVFEEDDEGLADIGAALALIAAGRPAPDVPLDLRGTVFQAQVWDALTRIPLGQTRTYTEVAIEIGRPTAVRAVASACARNRVALVVPCHRVVRTGGALGGYRWGVEVKRELLRAEGFGPIDVEGIT